MAENHPTELDLLAYAEGDLERGRRAMVSDHLETCPACAEAVGRQELGREALRSAPQFELPAGSKERILVNIPARPGTRRLPSARLAVLFAVVAALAGLTTAVVVFAPGSTTKDEGAAPAAQEFPGATATEDRTAGGGEAAPNRAPAIRTVKGPPTEVAKALRSYGLDAKVTASGVEVRDASPAEVRRALAGRPGGLVPVYIP